MTAGNHYVEHLDLECRPVYGFRNSVVSTVHDWWRNHVEHRHGRAPTVDQAEYLVDDTTLQGNLLFIEQIERDPYFVFAGDLIESVASTPIARLRMSELNMPNDDLDFFKSVYQRAVFTNAPIGVTGRFQIDGEPADRFVSAYFPVCCEARGRSGIAAVVRTVA